MVIYLFKSLNLEFNFTNFFVLMEDYSSRTSLAKDFVLFTGMVV